MVAVDGDDDDDDDDDDDRKQKQWNTQGRWGNNDGKIVGDGKAIGI